MYFDVIFMFLMLMMSQLSKIAQQFIFFSFYIFTETGDFDSHFDFSSKFCKAIIHHHNLSLPLWNLCVM